MSQETFVEAFEEEATLDPHDWASFRSLAHRAVDEVVDYFQAIRQHHMWKPVPEQIREFHRQPLPHQPQGVQAAYDDFVENVLPYPTGNPHPRFWGWVMGNGSPVGVLADMLASTMNPNVVGGAQAPVLVELQVLDWLKEMLGFPKEASGLLVSGGSIANLTGMAVARNDKAGYDMRLSGVRRAEGPLTLYASTEVHGSVIKAAELLGLGRENLRLIPVDSSYGIDLQALRETIAKDRSDGRQPICVIGNAGTVNTGAFDDLNALADVCQEQNLWLHVDGAFGALARLAPRSGTVALGIEKADSLAFDLHKWMYMPYGIGCVLVKDKTAHSNSFGIETPYLARHERGLASAQDVWFGSYGIELSRSFRALKAWMSLKAHGADHYGKLIQRNIDQAGYLASLVEAAPELELMAPVPLNIVCFRYRIDSADDETLNQLNRSILMDLHDQGIAVPTYTTLHGRYAIRAAITNYRSRREDFDVLVKEVIRLGSHHSKH